MSFKNSHRVVVVLLVLCYKETSTQGIGYQCCGLFQMDSDGSVFIETNRPLMPPNSGGQIQFSAVRFRICNTNPIAIQLWKCASDMTSCVFKWQTIITPTSNQIAGDNITVNFGSAVTVTASDRLGIYSQYSASSPLSIPYGMDASLAFLYKSSSTYSDSTQFVGGFNISMSQNWMSRSFAGSIVFCQLADCVGISSQALAPIAPTRNHPNQPPPGKCCASQESCDMSSISGPMTNQTSFIKLLESQVDILQQAIGKFIDTTNPVTGVCPAGFTAGSHGLGQCYVLYRNPLPLASANLFCQDQFGAELVQINDKMEEDFIAQFIKNSATGIESYWLAAMYNTGDLTWYWFNAMTKTTRPLVYSKWKDGKPPMSNSIDNICSVLTVDKSQGTDVWTDAVCGSFNNFICEVPKTCF